MTFPDGLAVVSARMNAVLIGVLVYVAVQLLVGVVVSRRVRDEADYLLAGRSFGLGLSTFSVFATWFGAETCIGAAGRIYKEGLSAGSADPFGYAACLLFMGVAFAVPLWKRGLTTLADLFRQRYSVGVERFAVLLMAPTSILWAAAQIRAFGQVLDAAAGVGVTAGIFLAAIVVVIYTVSGGLRADVLTDLIQGIAIIVGLLAVLAALCGDMNALTTAWQAVDPARLKVFGGETPLLKTLEAWAVPVCGSVVAQELVARILAARSPEIARRSAMAGAGLYLVIGVIPAFIGLVGVSLVPNLQDPEQILPLVAQKHLPTFFYIVFVGALVSAILSTVDSTLLAASAVVSHNLVVPLMPGLSEARKVRVARVGVAVGGVIALGLALQAESIFELVESASSFGSAGIFVVMVFGLAGGFGGARAAAGALAAGVGVWLAATYLWKWELPYLASLAGALVAYVLLGLTERRGGLGVVKG